MSIAENRPPETSGAPVEADGVTDVAQWYPNPEGVPLELIDRPIEAVDERFGGHLGTENTPSYVTAAAVHEQGAAAIADIGCGTGNTLFTLGKSVGLDNVSMTGISLEDYSGNSANPDTRAACKGTETTPPVLDYHVGNATHMPEIPTASQDVVLSYNSIYHSGQPKEWLAEMIRIARPGATILFNTDPGQLGTDVLDSLRDSGYSVLDSFSLPEHSGDVQFFRVNVPQSETPTNA
jgi:SAM-dependent methyltransferase